MKVMELFRSPEYEFFDPTMHDIGTYQSTVMDALKHIVARFSSDLKVTVRTTWTDLTTPTQSTKNTEEMISDPPPPDLIVSFCPFKCDESDTNDMLQE